jgi:hypothetical protein
MGDVARELGLKNSPGLQEMAASMPQSYMIPLPDAAAALPAMPGPQGTAPDVSQPSFADMAPMLTALADQPVPAATEDPEPSNNPYTPFDPKEPSDEPKEPSDEDIEVVGDSWQPKKLSPLEEVANLFLGGYLGIKNKQKNMRSAMEGFQRDPDQAARRMRQVDPKEAWKMYEDTSRIKYNQSLTKSTEQKYQITADKAISGALVSMSKDPEAAKYYDKVRPILQETWDRVGGKTQLPEVYDADTLGTIGNLGMSAYQAQRLDQQERGLQSLVGQREATVAETQRHNQTTEAETRRSNEVDEALAGEKFTFSQKKSDKGMKSLFSLDRRDESGNPMPVGTMSADGRIAGIYGSDGKVKAFRLRVPGDLSSRVRSPNEDAILQAAIDKAKGE